MELLLTKLKRIQIHLNSVEAVILEYGLNPLRPDPIN